MEKLHPFSLALIISSIYCLDSVTVFDGIFVPLPDIQCPNHRCAGEKLIEKENNL